MSDAPDEVDLPPALAETAAERLLALAGDERERALAALLAAHPQHAAALRRLGGQLAGAEAMLDATFTAVRGEAPASVGGHRVLRTLGEGAFGVVYLCRQQRPVVRDVAIKVLRPGAGNQQTLHRFAVERQLLATLSHPAITQVFDAGELPDGRPFFVMEYVDGVTIRTWCERHALPCDARLRLFVQVCRGVAHAHSRGIVHRDLKPANVLVADGSDGPSPKIIDFGIAKALHATQASGVQQTATGRVIGTPGYMSPEQAAGRTGDVDARADVFALGVMLYELLTGALPWDDGAAATDTDPLRPSQRVTTQRDGPAPATRQLVAQLRGDLDWITLKALARDRDERYPSVAALIADLERHLAGEAVSAGPPSLRYRVRKLVRRRRNAVFAASVAGALAVGLLLALWHASNKETEAELARSDARARVADARSIVARLLQRADDPELYGTAEGDAVRKALSAEALHVVEVLLASEPRDAQLQGSRCEALLSIAGVHYLLGEPTQARAVAADALHIGERLLAAEPTQLHWRGLVGGALHQLGRAVMLAGDNGKANDHLQAAVEHLATCAAAEPAVYAATLAAALGDCANTMSVSTGERRIETCRRAIAVYESLPAHTEAGTRIHADYVATCLLLARALLEGKLVEQAKTELDRIAPETERLGPDQRAILCDYQWARGTVRWRLGDQEAALTDFEASAASAEQSCRAQPRRNGAHRALIHRLKQLGLHYYNADRFDAMTATFRRALDASAAMVREFPDDARALADQCVTLCTFADLLRDRACRSVLAEAAACMQLALEVDTRIPASVRSNRMPRWQLLTELARIEQSRGSAAASRLWSELREALPARSEDWSHFDDNMWVAAMTGIAAWQFENGERDAARERLQQAVAGLTANGTGDIQRVEIEWLGARIDAHNGDHAAVAETADRVYAMFAGGCRGADGLYLAWRTARSQPGVDPQLAASYRDRAIGRYGEVLRFTQPDAEQFPHDPYHVAVWGFCELRRAMLIADTGNTELVRTMLENALPRLEAVRADTTAGWWDEELFRSATELLGQLRR